MQYLNEAQAKELALEYCADDRTASTSLLDYFREHKVGQRDDNSTDVRQASHEIRV